MICPNCGREIPETAKVCGYCGTRLAAPGAQPPEAVGQETPRRSEPESSPESGLQEEPEPQVEEAAEPEPEPEPELQGEPESEPEPDTEPESELEPEPTREPEPKPDPEWIQGPAASTLRSDGEFPVPDIGSRPSRRRWPWIAGIAAIVIAGAAGAVMLSLPEDEPTATEEIVGRFVGGLRVVTSAIAYPEDLAGFETWIDPGTALELTDDALHVSAGTIPGRYVGLVAPAGLDPGEAAAVRFRYAPGTQSSVFLWGGTEAFRGIDLWWGFEPDIPTVDVRQGNRHLIEFARYARPLRPDTDLLAIFANRGNEIWFGYVDASTGEFLVNDRFDFGEAFGDWDVGIQAELGDMYVQEIVWLDLDGQ